MKYLPAIDGLRAIAVLAVVAYHAGLPVPAGFVGVDVFFVISGYLITRLLADELPRIDFLHFYARRARRILPAMAVVVIATLIASLALLPNAHDAAQSAAAAAAFVANVFFQTKTGGYWSASAETMPLLHLWSLSVEEQFYLVWPFVLLLARRRPVVALWALAGVSFVAAEALIWWSPNAAFYQMPARAWELAAGGLVALGAIRSRSPVLGLVLVLAACFVPLPHFPGLGALPAVVGATLLIAGLHAGGTVRVLETRPMVAVGLISYSLYLWHWPLLAFYRATRVGETPLGLRLALVAAAFALAVLSYRFVEQPVRRLRARHGRTVATGLACAIALSAGSLAAAPKSSAVLEEAVALPCQQRAQQFAAPECVAGHRKVVLWGDSFAPRWRPLAEQIAAAERLPATWFVSPGCPVTIGQTIKRKTSRETEQCREHNASVAAYIAHDTDTAVITTNLIDLFHDYPEQAKPGFLAAVRAIEPHVRRIVIVAPTPILKDERVNCEAAGDPCMVGAQEFSAQVAPVRAALAELASPKVEVIDPSGWFLRGDRSLYDDRTHVSTAAVKQYLRHRPVGVTR